MIKHSSILFICVFYLAPIIDSITGWLIHSHLIHEGSIGSPSQILRLLIASHCLYILRTSFNYILLTTFIICYFICIEYFVYLSHQSTYGYMIGIVYSSKIIYLFIIYFTMYKLFVTENIPHSKLIFMLRDYSLIVSIIILTSFLTKTGYSTYIHGSFGTKGYFASGNGLGLFTGTGLLVTIYCWNAFRSKVSLYMSFPMFGALMLIGTKTALLFFVLSLFFYILNGRKSTLTYLLCVTSIILVLQFNEYIVILFSNIYDVVIDRFHRHDTFLAFITSSRDTFFHNAFQNYTIDGMHSLRLAFGFGTYISFRDPSGHYPYHDTLESDILDLFFMYGAIVTFVYLLIFTIFFLSAIRYRLFQISFIFLLVCLHSFVAGHVIFNGMSGLLVAIIALYIQIYLHEGTRNSYSHVS